VFGTKLEHLSRIIFAGDIKSP